MKLSHTYNSKDKTGYINEDDKEAFLALVDKMNKSSFKRAQTSHKKSLEKFQQRRAEYQSFEDWYEDADMPEKIDGEWVDLETGLPWR